jgi:hypothetical protein
MTFADLVALLVECGVRRARVTEHASAGLLVIELPRSAFTRPRVYLMYALIEERKPVGVRYAVAALPWWRCWFTKFQLRTERT